MLRTASKSVLIFSYLIRASSRPFVLTVGTDPSNVIILNITSAFTGPTVGVRPARLVVDVHFKTEGEKARPSDSIYIV